MLVIKQFCERLFIRNSKHYRIQILIQNLFSEFLSLSKYILFNILFFVKHNFISKIKFKKNINPILFKLFIK